MTDKPSITCPICGLTSYHPKDIEHGFCGNCHLFRDDISVDELVADEFKVKGGPLDGLVLKKIPENPTPEEEQKIIDAGIAFIMGEPPPED